MKNRMILLFVLTGFMLCSSTCSQADSIWARRDQNIKNLYADDVARYVGDVLTILITEDSKIDNKAKRDLKKETSRSTEFNGELNIDHVLPKIPGFTMEAESSNELKGKADFKDERSFVDSVTVVVVDVLPNGNLVVMGTRNRDIGGDKQVIEVSGIVRPSDIDFDNTVKSERVGDFRIVSRNSGVAEPYNRQGWLGRIFDLLWWF